MKFSVAPLVLALATVASALPSAAPVTEEVAVAQPFPYYNEFLASLAELEASGPAIKSCLVNAEESNVFEKRDLTKAECKSACKAGMETFEWICRRIPHPAIRYTCWGIAAGLQTSAGIAACTAFCSRVDLESTSVSV
ncbi:hypothetical protein BJ508DRAFT_366469 [Ascobolus immersus RN42]|uniref:Fungal calcium binding protein domain-containing protein n=1 Tax=Ascobolus immersus RN42 TaxID=1160509 RepID=A0A3N4HQC3_ASCIM|nr:hypothetical protein BJ508DRAFT_366469 [Ascobolus immersus RN42]